MSKQLSTVSSLTAAVTLALTMQALPAQAQGMKDMGTMPQVVKDNMMKMTKNKT